MNTAKVYATGVGKTESTLNDKVQRTPEEKERDRVQALTDEQNRKASIHTWEQNPITQEFFKEIENEILKLDNRARELAHNYHNTKNHDEILQVLIRASTLRKVININANSEETNTHNES